MRTWFYETWGGERCEVSADSVEFTATHVVFRDEAKAVVLAEHSEQVRRLSDKHISSRAYATRRLRPIT